MKNIFMSKAACLGVALFFSVNGLIAEKNSEQAARFSDLETTLNNPNEPDFCAIKIVKGLTGLGVVSFAAEKIALQSALKNKNNSKDFWQKVAKTAKITRVIGFVPLYAAAYGVATALICYTPVIYMSYKNCEKNRQQNESLVKNPTI